MFLPAEGRRRAPAAGRRPLQAESSPAEARTPCWDRQRASAALRAAAVGPLSSRPVPASEQAESAPESAQVQQQPLLRLAASNRAAARRPCWDRRRESAQQAAVVVAPSSSPAERVVVLAAQVAQLPRPVQAWAWAWAWAPAAAVPRPPS